MVQKSIEIAVVDENAVKNRIHVIRGIQVMLDFSLVEIYGFTTSVFDQQVKRNIERFDADFRFQLNQAEFEKLSISQNVTSIQTKGVKGGRSKLPYAFTESGIYMLMTVVLDYNTADERVFIADRHQRIQGRSWLRLRSLLKEQ